MTGTQTGDGTAFDILVRGCTIVSGIPGAPILRDGAIGIRGDRIAYVGPDAPALAGGRVIAAGGQLAIPGLVNVHTHALLSHSRGMTEDLGFAPAYMPGVPHAYDLREDEAVPLARLGALEAMLFGSTLINDMYIHAGATLPAMAEIGLRVSSAVWIHDVDFTRVHDRVFAYDPAIGRRTLDGALAIHAAQHGTADGRVTVMLGPHAIDTCSLAFLREVAAARAETDGLVMTHLAQSRLEVEQVRARDGMTPAEVAEEAGLLDGRLIAAHCLVMTDGDIARVGRAGITVAHAPKINMTGGYLPVTSRLRRAGARIALATDNMHADLVEVLRWALVAGRLQEGAVTDLWDSASVFGMATRDAAAAMGRGHDLGSLEVGKKADLVLVDMRRAHLTPGFDPVATLVHAGQGRDVSTVLVDGRVVVEDGRATLVDEERIRREGREAARRLWTRVQGRSPSARAVAASRSGAAARRHRPRGRATRTRRAPRSREPSDSHAPAREQLQRSAREPPERVPASGREIRPRRVGAARTFSRPSTDSSASTRAVATSRPRCSAFRRSRLASRTRSEAPPRAGSLAFVVNRDRCPPMAAATMQAFSVRASRSRSRIVRTSLSLRFSIGHNPHAYAVDKSVLALTESPVYPSGDSLIRLTGARGLCGTTLSCGAVSR